MHLVCKGNRVIIMGNSFSHEEGSEDEEVQVQEKQFAVQNGSVPLQNATLVKVIPSTDQVDGKKVTQQKSIISSTQKTIVFSPISNGEIDSKPPAPTAQSKFRLSISRPPSGRTIFQVNGLEGEKVKTAVPSEEPLITENQNGTPVVLETSVTNASNAGIQNQPPPSAIAISAATPPSVAATNEPPLAASLSNELETPTKPKEISFFERIFMPEKKVQIEEPQQPQLEENEEAGIMVEQNAGLQSMPLTSNAQAQNIDEFNQEAGKEFSSELTTNQENHNSPITLEASLPAPPSPEAHPVMSFFKTLVSPNKSVLKSEEESKKDSDDKKKENGGLRKSSSRKEKAKSLPQQTAESEAKSTKKSESPKSRTLSRLFGHKSKKGEELTSGNKVVEEKPVAVTINSEQPSPEQILTQDTILSEPNVQLQISAPASKDEGKAAKESTPRPRPFWRKSFKGEPPTTKQEENVEEEQPVATLTINSVSAAPEQIVDQNIVSAEPNVQIEIPSQTSDSDRKEEKETTPERPRPFWRKSFKGDPAVPKIQENVEEQQPEVAITVNSDSAAPEQQLNLEMKPIAANGQPEIPNQPLSNYEKAEKESSPQRPVPFWRKSFKGHPQPVKNEENSLKEEPEAEPITENASAEKEAKADAQVQAATSSGKGQESPDKGKKAEDGKNTKPKLMMFFKQLSVIGDGGNGNSEEVNEKSTDQSKLDLTDGTEATKPEKTVVSAVVEPPPPAPKIKENQKEKKVVVEKMTKQESKDMPEAVSPTQQQASNLALVQNGSDATKDGQLKRTEKRQSLGNFFKAIGPKRLSDAAVQTDPVCIVPAEKAK
ncbi:breast carcinoma-amplified sequence 1 homolog isoform X2 [Xenopus laevis]|uniref:Breast carcinoma-amplified sequence 1 homolog isoform X2 n=1 Tax=Xenopus laevis TaxID=8355 RepID=A0A8J1LQY9_XENLA|nr:breast carcinoma-amplified sequence 1 homolog isoform X2 [Xenopus laevis]